jgi:hypothetical protein
MVINRLKKEKSIEKRLEQKIMAEIILKAEKEDTLRNKK